MKMKTAHTIEGTEIELDIAFDYTPEEPEVRYYKDGSGQPATPPDIEITDVIWTREDLKVGSGLTFEKTKTPVDVFELMDKLGHMDEIEKTCWGMIENINFED